MALFKKYFGQDDNDLKRNHEESQEIIKEYTNTVNHIAWDYFFFEDRLNYMGDLHPGYETNMSIKRSNPEKYYNLFLKEYEPKIVSLIILGYFMLHDLKFNEKCHGSLISLTEKSSLFKSVVINLAIPIAEKRGELYFAMEKKVKPVTLNDNDYAHRLSIVYLYIINRIHKYSKYIINGLDDYSKNPEDDDNPSLDRALCFYSNPMEELPSVADESDMPLKSFRNYVRQGYLYLKDNLPNG